MSFSTRPAVRAKGDERITPNIKDSQHEAKTTFVKTDRPVEDRHCGDAEAKRILTILRNFLRGPRDAHRKILARRQHQYSAEYLGLMIKVTWMVMSS